MKRLFYIVFSSVISATIVVALTWIIGAMFGPLYQGEDESTRNFKIFLAVFITSIIVGGIAGNRFYNKSNER